MGRLDTQKGFDLLLRAFAKCCRERPDWALTIIGEGEERDELQALAQNLDIASKVRFTGRVAVPAALLRRADLFVLSSRYEGFPNALLEAMAVGLPVIATDCPSGPAHIVRNDIDGILVPTEDVDALATAMAGLMDDDAWRKRLGASATSVVERFSVERIMEHWDSLLEQVTRDRTAGTGRRHA
jgi:glycosyltransferase involved in cell wall biosynthesis